jgi:hypothetical protein
MLTFVGLWLVVVAYLHLAVWYEAKQIGDLDPKETLVPQPLPNHSVADLEEGMTISRFGYSVRLPWAKAKMVKDFKSVTAIGFDNGSSILISNPSDRWDLLAEGANNARASAELKALIGDQATSSHYEYARAELEASPKDVSFFRSRRQDARAMMLLPMKFIEIPEGVTAIYEIHGGQTKGFQFGDPRKAPTFVELLLFDDDDHVLKLIIKGPKGSTGPVLTQPQVNAIAASVRHS